MTEILSAAETRTLAEREAVIERGLNTFIDVGNALYAIREERLYRADHPTFEAYCRHRWGMGRDYADRMITAASVVPTIVSTGLPAPANEGQARALARVPEAERPDVWSATLERTDGKPTAAAIRDTYTQTRPPEPKKAPEPEERIGFYRVHPFLALFPWADDDLFAGIVDSIKRIGLLNPIVLTHDRKTLVDGRIRYRACEAAGVEPKFTVLGAYYTERMILDFIWSMNMVRSHASTVELTMTLVDLQEGRP